MSRDTTAGIPAVIEEVAGGSVYYIREPNGALIARVDGETTHYYHFDALGSTRVLTDGNGAKTDEYTYDAWGKLTNHTTYTGSVPQPYIYVGQLGYYSHHQDQNLFDESGWQMLQLGVRLYDPALSRFTQMDRVRLAGGYYEYAADNPLLYVDSDGQRPVNPGDRRFPQPAPHGAGGVVFHWNCILQARDNAERIVGRHFPPGTPGLHNGPPDAFRHCVWACLVRKTCGAAAYNSGVIDHEADNAPWARGGWNPNESPMDLANDEVGRKCSGRGGSCEQACVDAYHNDQLYWLPRLGYPVGSTTPIAFW